MDISRETALIMTRYAFLLTTLAINNDNILIAHSQNVKDVIWDCQCALLEFSDKPKIQKAKHEFYSSNVLVYGYIHQLLLIAADAVTNNHILFVKITIDDLNKIVVV